MAWTKSKSEKRIADHLASMADIEIKPLEREVQDLSAVLSESKCREIDSAHVYADISNFADLASGDPEKAPAQYRKIIRMMHVYQRMITKLVEAFGGVRVHFQGPRLHALIYRPTDANVRARRAVLLEVAIADFVANVFNPAFTDVADLSIRAGADIGLVVGTKNGVGGDREMLFVGNAANQAAKIIGGSKTLYLSAALYELLPEIMQASCTAAGAKYRINLSHGDFDAAVADEGVPYSRESFAKLVQDERSSIKLDEIEYSDAYVPVNFSGLSVYNNKRVKGATIFADLSGFTAYVAAATTEAARKERLRVFAAYRKELAKVAKNDFEGVRVQYQGDRVQVLLHMPRGDDEAIAEGAVQIALAMQSSVEVTLKAALPESSPLTLAIGIDLGPTLASSYGTRGQRDRMCIGSAVDTAAELEEKTAGGSVAISSRAYDALTEATRKLFTKSGEWYVAKGKFLDDYGRAVEASAKYSSPAVHLSKSGTAAVVSAAPTAGSIATPVSRSHA